MELEEIKALASDFDKLQSAIIGEKVGGFKPEYANQYDPKKHDVADPTKRQDKVIDTDNGPSTVYVNRVPIPMQKKIVRTAVGFLCGNPIRLSATPAPGAETYMLAALQKVWRDNKLYYANKKLLKYLLSETEVAEVWYTEPVDPSYWATTKIKGNFRPRMKILANSLGDSLYPSFNAQGDLIAFARGYSLKKGDATEDHFDVYLSDSAIKGTKTGSGWLIETEPNAVGKIQLIYWRQDYPEWYDADEATARKEKVVSNLGDTNDYFGSPTAVSEGDVDSMSKKGDQGKFIQVKNGAKVYYLTWDQSPESTKLEYNILRSLEYEMTETPDTSWESMKGLGDLSGVSLQILFMGAHMKAAEHEEVFGEGMQRRLNYLMAALAKIDVSLEKGLSLVVSPTFEYFLPKNNQEVISNLSTATGAKPTMSQMTAVKLNPYVTNPEEELAQMKAEGLDTEMND